MRELLIVEDDASLRESLAVALENDYNLRFAGSTEEAQARLEQAPADLMVLDERLPGMHGTAWLASLAGKGPPAIILMSANADPEMARKAMRLGALDCLTKPFDLNVLKAKLRQALEGPRRGRMPEEPFGLQAARRLAQAILHGPERPLDAELSLLQRQLVLDALDASAGEKGLAARRLGLTPEELNVLLPPV